jgi:hypothetical protein
MTWATGWYTAGNDKPRLHATRGGSFHFSAIEWSKRQTNALECEVDERVVGRCGDRWR